MNPAIVRSTLTSKTFWCALAYIGLGVASTVWPEYAAGLALAQKFAAGGTAAAGAHRLSKVLEAAKAGTVAVYQLQQARQAAANAKPASGGPTS